MSDGKIKIYGELESAVPDGYVVDSSQVRGFKEAITSGIQTISHAALVNLVSAGGLVPGRQYRITDYRFGAGHQFDIVVTALSENLLSEDARAMHHKGDLYFETSRLEHWELKYSLMDDKSRFGWSSPYGIIYHMKDEWGNEAPYDFKNMLFSPPPEFPEYTEGLYTFSYGGNGPMEDYSMYGNCRRNVIKPLYAGYILPNRIFFVDPGGDMFRFENNVFEPNCHDCVIMGDVLNSKFDSNVSGVVLSMSGNCFNTRFTSGVYTRQEFTVLLSPEPEQPVTVSVQNGEIYVDYGVAEVFPRNPGSPGRCLLIDNAGTKSWMPLDKVMDGANVMEMFKNLNIAVFQGIERLDLENATIIKASSGVEHMQNIIYDVTSKWFYDKVFVEDRGYYEYYKGWGDPLKYMTSASDTATPRADTIYLCGGTKYIWNGTDLVTC